MTSRAAWKLLLAAILCGRPVAASAGLFPEGPFSDKAAGTTGAAFLGMPAGARGLALGSSLAAAVDDSEAMFWNPAGLARMEAANDSEFSFSFGALIESSHAGSLAYAHPFSDGRGVLGVSLVYLSQSSIKGFNAVGDSDGSYSPNDLAFSAAYGKKLGIVSLGGAVKLIRSQVADVSGVTFAMDMGVQAERVTDIGGGALDLGASVRNLGPALKLGSASDPLPFKFQLGALWRISPRVSGLLDGHIPVDDNPYASLGVEMNYPAAETVTILFRAGYNVANESDIDGLTGMTAGFGIRVVRLRMDYAWVPLGDLGSTHRISMGFLF